jgi:UDP-N-acetylmuramoylalanine--D-glutamate ligase
MNMPDSIPVVSEAILVLGLGETGLAAARWCERSGHAVRVADTRPAPPALERARAMLQKAELCLGLAVFEEH